MVIAFEAMMATVGRWPSQRLDGDHNCGGWIVWTGSTPKGHTRRCVRFDRAKGKINFEPKTSFDEGLKQTIDWFVSSQD